MDKVVEINLMASMFGGYRHPAFSGRGKGRNECVECGVKIPPGREGRRRKTCREVGKATEGASKVEFRLPG